ncbi:hypothetical protein NDU88_001822 [Pleurodeles waltl]|uniref:Uncharacterized protein n=1 Tax=Pleurodeles waltl TaxID=8319 RepID=A0AAV7T0F7_PLEWA|nr:hypothetical protein NDU88_001822 [Pleurodeles waltl]
MSSSSPLIGRRTDKEAGTAGEDARPERMCANQKGRRCEDQLIGNLQQTQDTSGKMQKEHPRGEDDRGRTSEEGERISVQRHRNTIQPLQPR